MAHLHPSYDEKTTAGEMQGKQKGLAGKNVLAIETDTRWRNFALF
jgi:hypothetical protein